MFEKIIRKLTKTKGGLKKLTPDGRDFGFSFEFLFGYSYSPKNKSKFLNNKFMPKTQMYNTCGWTATTGAKEIDELVELDERSIIAYGRKMGYISEDGFSNLRDNEKSLKDFGVCEKGIIRINYKDFNTFGHTGLLTDKVVENASKHKSKSFSPIHTTSMVYKAIDDGRPVKIGVSWRTAMNMGGGFKAPWILNFRSGWAVGGHAMYVIGYDTSYQCKRCFRIRNSFGNTYGDNGDCWITEEDLQKQIELFGAFTNLDESVDVMKWLRDNQGAVVKSKSSPKVFLIQGDKKRHYADLATLYAHGKTPMQIKEVDSVYLDAVKEGEEIKFWDGGSIKQIKTWVEIHPEIKSLFQKYLSELI